MLVVMGETFCLTHMAIWGDTSQSDLMGQRHVSVEAIKVLGEAFKSCHKKFRLPERRVFIAPVRVERHLLDGR